MENISRDHISAQLSRPIAMEDIQIQRIVLLATLLLILAIFSGKLFQSSPYPLVNGKKIFELTNTRSKKEFIATPHLERFRKHFKEAPGKPFRLITTIGEVTVLPPEYAPEISGHKDLDFHKAARKMFFADVPGLQGFGFEGSEIMKLVIKRQFTHQLSLLVKPMSEECAAGLHEICSGNEEWHDIPVRETLLYVMSRLTSRVFLGEKLCRDPNWLRITTAYPVACLGAVAELQLLPRFVTSIAHWFLPKCREARKLTREAHVIIEELVQSRKGMGQSGKSEYNDAIEFMERTAQQEGKEYSHELRLNAQLCLSVAPVLSTTDLLTQVVYDIVTHPEIIEPLRAEIVSVLGQGMTNQALNDLKLMDSVLKESLRLKPIGLTSLKRVSTTNVTLSKGVVIPKNTLSLVPIHRQMDPDVYENPETWDGYRFFRIRQKGGKKSQAELTGVTAEHMGFGYGVDACPGRFFAAANAKIVLCHLLMKYDLKLLPESNIAPRVSGFSMSANPTGKVAIRKSKVDEDFLDF